MQRLKNLFIYIPPYFRLREHLFSEYSIHTRPVVDQLQPINITLGVEINQIISVDERSQQVCCA